MVGGFSECIKGYDIDECHSRCTDFIEEDNDYDPYYDYFCKPKWNEPRGRCIEGIPIDKKIPKTHKDEYDYKKEWRKLNTELIIRLYGVDWCMRHGWL